MTAWTWNALLVAMIATPLLLAAAGMSPRLRRWILHLSPWAAAPAVALALAAVLGMVPEGEAALATEVLGGLRLALDDTGRAFLLLTSLLWMAGGAFARNYHAADSHRDGLAVFLLLAMTGNLGLVVAGDVLAFYLFFVIMTFSAYGLVVHERDERAYRAGRIYIVLTVMGDLAILAGVFALGAAAPGSPGFGPEMDATWLSLQIADRAPGPELTAALLLGGFGVKVGLLPLHVWLPLAYRAAPPAASALLGGAMVNAGVLAWIRFLPGTTGFPALSAALLVMGVAAALYGVVVGLVQDEAKTILAYSSVSQLGFVTVAAGVMLQSPEIAAVGAGAATIYAVHHGLAKGALFLAVGVMDRASGRNRRRGWILAATSIPALAIAGAPLTSGARAKGSLEEALAALGEGWYHALEPLLVLAALGTTLLLARFLVVLERRQRGRDQRNRGSERQDRQDRWDGGIGRIGGSGRSVSDGDTPWGLVGPWFFLVAAGASAVLWLPVTAPPGAELPGVLHAPVRSLLPVALGAVVAWAVHRRPGLLGPLARIGVQAGDLIVPVEASLRRLRRIPWHRLGGQVVPVHRRLGRAWTVGGDLVQSLADRDLLLMRGVILGVLFLLVLGLLLLAGLP